MPLTREQREAIAEARRIATSRLAEREKAAREHQTDRQRIEDEQNRAIEAIRRGK